MKFAKRYDAEQALTYATVLNGKNLKMSWHTITMQAQGGEGSANGGEGATGEAVDENMQVRIGDSGDKRKVVARK